MKVFALPQIIRGIAFDIDNTLYRHEEYVSLQTDLLIARLARERGASTEEMRKLIVAYRDEQAAANEGRKPSLGNIFLHFGVPIQLSVRWREEELAPERYLKPDAELAVLLSGLGDRVGLCCVTNNPQSTARRTLRALGIEAAFSAVVGLDDTMVSKPNALPFRRAAELLNLSPSEMVSIGDRYEVDLEPALAIGMGGILVESRADLFALPLAGIRSTEDR